jgi:sphingomyelin phosphodiesterase 2
VGWSLNIHPTEVDIIYLRTPKILFLTHSPYLDVLDYLSFFNYQFCTMPDTLRIISLNCWGLKFLSEHRHERLSQIGSVLANASPPPDIVGLQECWTQQDYNDIRQKMQAILPCTKFYHSGVFGGGLAILSRWPIVESTMVKYSLNGRPTAFFRGDWYVGKGVACATIRMDDGELMDVFCTHVISRSDSKFEANYCPAPCPIRTRAK